MSNMEFQILAQDHAAKKRDQPHINEMKSPWGKTWLQISTKKNYAFLLRNPTAQRARRQH